MAARSSCAVLHAGNVATEDLVYLLDGLGIQHGVDLSKLLAASQFICSKLGVRTGSSAGQALLAKQQAAAAVAAAA